MQKSDDQSTTGARDAAAEPEHATLMRKFNEVLSGQLKMSASAYINLVRAVNAAGATGGPSPEGSHVLSDAAPALKI